MRFSAVLALCLTAHVVAQTTTIPAPEPGPDPEPTRSIDPEPTRSEPAETDTLAEPSISDSLEPTSTSSTTPPLPTGSSPATGGGNCAQACLVEAASQVGCGSSVDFSCICKSATYLNIAQACFGSTGCSETSVRNAEQDYQSSCRQATGTGSSQTQTTSRNTVRTRTNTGTLTSLTTQTLVLTSGQVVTLSDGIATTIASGFTTIRTGQVGDLAGGIPAATSPANNGAVSNLDWSKWSGMSMMVGLGMVGGMIVLAV